MTRGTCHFVSHAAAVRYYSAYQPKRSEAVQLVNQKLAEKEIAIGEPKLAPGERLKINRQEGRYFIEESEG